LGGWCLGLLEQDNPFFVFFFFYSNGVECNRFRVMLIRYFVVYNNYAVILDKLGGGRKTDIWNELKLPVICSGWSDISAVINYPNSFLREI